MKRILMYGVGLALLIGVVGCGSAGISEGTPSGDLKSGGVPIPADMTKPGGNFGAAAASKASAKNAEQAKIDSAKAPATTPESK